MSFTVMFGQRIIKDAVADPLVHIADTVVLMNGKNNGSARALCS